MSIQRHPVDSFSPKLNFWEEFPDYKVHKQFGDFWRANKKADQLQKSSLFMWALSLCYDRKSVFYSQPELDKWEVVSEDLFDNKDYILNLIEEPEECSDLIFQLGGMPRDLIEAFETTIDTPLGISLRRMEKKLEERTRFMAETKYSMDYYQEREDGRKVIMKGTVDQLDKMFTNTDKIESLITKALDALRAAEGAGTAKGGAAESLSDEDKTF
jgi:hypothetical protein